MRIIRSDPVGVNVASLNSIVHPVSVHARKYYKLYTLYWGYGL